MTLIVGIVCKDGVLISSDSQTTDEWGMARTDATKIYKIEMADKSSGLVATAGGVEWGIQIVEIMENMARQTKMEQYRSLADLAEKANEQIKQRERHTFRRSSSELKRHFEENRCVLLIANCFKGKPYIFTLKSDGLVSPTPLKNQLFTAVGNSYAVANYILKKFDFSEMMVGIAEVIGLYTINEVIHAKDTSCYYPLQVGYVFPYKSDFILTESEALISENEDVMFALGKIISKTKRLEVELTDNMNDVFMDVATNLQEKFTKLNSKTIKLKSELAELKKQKNNPS